MRPILLKIKGLNSFIEEQTIDFARLMEPGLFGIFGPTGSGKTTILDGITLALFGEIARKSKNFVNTNCKSASVLYEFQISGAETKKYRVEREFKQDANKEGYKTGKCRLSDITDGEPIILADKVTEVNSCCIEIIGLKSDDFQRTVVLPQGRFSEFLKLEGKKRSEMLERLFRLQPYGDGLARKLKAKSDEITLMRSNLEGQLKSFEDISQEKIEEKEQEVAGLATLLKEKTEALQAYIKVYENGKEIWNLQTEKEKYMIKKVQLDSKREEIQKLEQKLMLAEKADRIYPYIQDLEASQKELGDKEKELEILKKEKEDSEQAKLVIEQEFNIWKQRRDTDLPVLRQKIQTYKEAIEKQTEYLQTKKDCRRVEQSLAVKEQESKKIKVQETGLKQVIEENNQKLEALQQKQKQYEIPAQMRNQIQIGIGLEQQVSILHERMQKQEIDYEKLQKERNDKKTLFDHLAAVLYPDGVDKDESIQEYTNKLNDLKEKKKAYRECLEKTEVKTKEVNGIQNELERLIQNKVFIQNEFETYQNLKEKLETELMSYQLRQKLMEGAPCPVCGSVHHEYHEIQLVDSEQFEKVTEEYQKWESQLRDLEKKEFSYATELSRVQKELRDLQSSLDELKRDAEMVTEEEITKRLTAASNYEPARVAFHMLDKSVSEKESELQKEKEECRKHQENLGRLLNEVSFPSFAAAGEKLRKCDEMLDKLKDNVQLGMDITETRRKELEECKNRENACITDMAILRESQKNYQSRMETLQKRFHTSIGALDGISIEDSALQLKLEEAKVQEQKIEEKYRETENKKEAETNRFVGLHGKYLEQKAAFEMLVKNMEEARKRLEEMLKKEEFESRESCMKNMLVKSEQQETKTRIEAFRTEYSENEGVLSNIVEQLAGRSISGEQWSEMEKQKKEQETFCEELTINYHNQQQNYNRMLADWDRQKALLIEKKKIEHQESLMADLTQLFRGKRFVEYVAYSKLKYISKAASHRLRDISNGNYGLEIDPNGKFVVCDYKNGGVKRDAFTLSGGETFLVSLSLSLALSEQVQLKGTAPLELFFLDEGFGTLDDELLEVVMSSLERIQNKHLTVGIISHVEAVKNRVPIKLIVTPSVSGLGGTKVHIEKN